MKVATKPVLLTVVVGVGVLVGGFYIHQRYAPHPLPTTTVIGTSESDADDLHYKLHTRLSSSEKLHLFDGDCHVVTSTDALPVSIKNAFATVTRDAPFALANPGTRFNATDVIEPGLPRRRMDLAGVCENRWFIQYERGGIGLNIMVMVLRLESNGDVHFMWGGEWGDNRPANLANLRDAIASGQTSDSDWF